ncbi:response regulator transcription factor [Bradyrhizobium zhanjiangense]|uniref:response regulator transcription factor n=1 Tax=Bradyrhizobium zhanjiangense TaxID=1325107 RepID=UPI001008BEE9|nr:response regulator [Bradyrhizobium zhanjiangense]
MNKKALICVVDDDALLRESLNYLLRAAGHEVACFGSAESFLDTEESERCDCVVADIDMPGLSGIDLVERVVEMSDPPKVILISGRPEESWRERAMYSGAVGFFRKPIEAQSLLDIVQRSVAA